MTTKLTWVKWEPSAFLNGVVGLDAEEIGVYTILLNLIYDSGGPIPDDVDRIARRCGVRPTSCEKVILALASAGKIIREFGVISNARAASELKTRAKVVEKWKKNFSGGDAKLTENINEIKDYVLPLGLPSAPPKRAVDKESVDKKERKESCLVAVANQTKPKKGYSQEFEVNFWQPYPRSPTMSKKQTWDAWQHLQPDQREDACKAIQPYRDSLRGGEKFTVHACRFLSQRRFEGFVNGGVVATASFDVRSVLV